ncbi:MAG: ParA family protein [Pseudomonadota bacterium]
MTRRLAILNRKGGVGKTALTVNVGHALARAGNKVALIDLDPQGHVATSFGFAPEKDGMDSVMLDNNPMHNVVQTVRENVDIFPSGHRLIEVEQLRTQGAACAKILSESQASSISDYDYVLYDCPPSAGVIMSNALLATENVVSPVTGDYLALEGLSCVARAIAHLKQALGHNLKHWVAMSRINVRRRINEDIFRKVTASFPDAVLPTVVREAAVLAECAGFGQTVFEFRGKCSSAGEFSQLATDIVKRW